MELSDVANGVYAHNFPQDNLLQKNIEVFVTPTLAFCSSLEFTLSSLLEFIIAQDEEVKLFEIFGQNFSSL